MRTDSGGDLARYCGIVNQVEETTLAFDPRPPLRAVREKVGPTDGSGDSLFRRADAQSSARCLLFGDSFANHIRAQLAEHFAELHDIKSHDFLVAKIEEIRPAVVVSQIAERLAVQWVPHNPVPVRRTPDEAELTGLDVVATPNPSVRGTELVGHRLTIIDGEPELVIAWRARERTKLAGRLRVKRCDGAGDTRWMFDWPQDPVESVVEPGTTWLDHLPLPPGVSEVQYGLIDAGGADLPFDLGQHASVVCRLRR